MELELWSVLLLVVAGVIAGAINAAAGGGSLVTFPALIAVGMPPLVANVTNNVAVFPGYVTGAIGYRQGLGGQGRRVFPLAVASAVGGLAGVVLVLVSSEAAFTGIVPFLVLTACALLAAQPFLGRFMGKRSGLREKPGLGAVAGQTIVAVYGGYFSAALGVAVLALLGLVFEDTLQRLNALKALLQLVIGGAAALGFALLAPVDWTAVAIVGTASLIGGQLGARLAQRVNDRGLRGAIVAYGVLAALWLFVR